MSIADKLTTIAENEQKVYEAGKKSEYDKFWDNYQDYGKRTDYELAFYYGWNDNIFNPKYDLILNRIGAERTFSYSTITDIKGILERNGLKFDSSLCESFTSTFYNCTTQTVPTLDLSNCKKMTMTFYNARQLLEIELVNLSANCVFDRVFGGADLLRKLIITGVIGQNGFDTRYNSQLDKESLTSIVNALSPTTTGLTVAFCKTAVNREFETSKGAMDGSTSEEWKALAATKSNWTIELI